MGKKNFRRVPDHITSKVGSLQSRYIVAGCVNVASADELRNGKFGHLHIRFSDHGLEFQPEILPSESRGKYSWRNTHGQVIVRRDLPKETYSVSIESPNWGDSSRGTHTVTWTRERYQRDFVGPAHSTISIECENSAEMKPAYPIKFEVREVLDNEADDFNARLLTCINILQENVGYIDVARAGASFDDYLRTLRVTWEILPPGSKEEVLSRLFGRRQPSPDERRVVDERYDYFASLRPQQIICGSSGFQRYFGALLNPHLVVFENVTHGNAIYVMYENWRDLSQKSRIELLSGRFGDYFDRVIHIGNWQRKTREIIDAHR